MDKIVIKLNGLTFELDSSNFTATIISSDDAEEEVFIERSIKNQSLDYVITKIGPKAFLQNIKTKYIEFSKDSELLSISEQAFNYNLVSLTIPSKLVTLEDNWCQNCSHLEVINISEDNAHFKFLDETKKIVVGRSHNCEEFDTIYFACRDIKIATIPSNIKEIKSNSFSDCSLCKIEFEQNSSLEIIRENAFNFIFTLKKLEIPSSVIKLEDGWFDSVYRGRYLSILIEKTVVSLSPGNKNYKFIDNKYIVGKSDSKSDEYDTIVYALNNFKEIIIPSSIKYIYSYAFNRCSKLKSVIFSEDSQLISIGKSAFGYTSIQSITIPSSCQEIKEDAFFFCNHLKVFEFLPDSKVRVIPSMFFMCSLLKKIFIPKSVEKLEKGWCIDTNLIDIEISPENHNFAYLDDEHKIVVSKSDSKSDIFDVIEIACRDIIDVFIPSTIKHIECHSFSKCRQIKTIKFSKDSQLETIGDSAFSQSSITSIDIPSSVIEIGYSCFLDCNNLQAINIPEDSQLKIAYGLFDSIPKITNKIFIPSQVTKIIDKFEFDIESNECEYIISPENNHFKFLDKEKKIIIGKKDEITSNDFDDILFAQKDIQHAYIPSTIKYIESAFISCHQLQEVIFEKNSQLISISNKAFAYSGIVNLTIPSNVKSIGLECFLGCKRIQKIDFEQNSELTTFEDNLLFESSIEHLSFPPLLSKLRKNWCHKTFKLNAIDLSPENKNFVYSDDSHQMILGKSNDDSYDSIVFVNRNCKKITIPSNIKIICSDAFSNSKIHEIFIPKSVTSISDYAFSLCSNLSSVEFEKDSNLNSLSFGAFSYTKIKKIRFQKNLKSFSLRSVSFCQHLKSIEFLADEMIFDTLFDCNIQLISLPKANKIKIIDCSFSNDNEIIFLKKLKSFIKINTLLIIFYHLNHLIMIKHDFIYHHRFLINFFI